MDCGRVRYLLYLGMYSTVCDALCWWLLLLGFLEMGDRGDLGSEQNDQRDDALMVVSGGLVLVSQPPDRDVEEALMWAVGCWWMRRDATGRTEDAARARFVHTHTLSLSPSVSFSL
ncbi:hypothetical protein LX36DRAFT_115450 [Colletotrichum falcatum]|nr:hypothetical protein LX36DRAFT_115450 [Colletotrichum falcatum]